MSIKLHCNIYLLFQVSNTAAKMTEKEFRLEPDSELRFEVEGKQDKVDLTVSFTIIVIIAIILLSFYYWLFISIISIAIIIILMMIIVIN